MIPQSKGNEPYFFLNAEDKTKWEMQKFFKIKNEQHLKFGTHQNDISLQI
jgi:hypothetical protein